jgi:cell division protein FtsW (lipid II flippase)
VSDVSYGDSYERGSGWLIFASIILMVAGVMRILDAIWAWRYDGRTPDEFQEAVLGHNLDTYGWVWFIVGIILILAGLAVMQRSQWARWIGIIAGAVIAITAVFWLPVYPVWSLIYIAIGVMVLYGRVAYGGRVSRV